MADNICFSGGADGADLAWGAAALKAGHDLKHFVFKGHKGWKQPNAAVVPLEDLKKADPIMKRVNDEVLHRSFPAHSLFVTNLLRRNYFQVVNSEAVYAIAGIDFDSQQVYGGTSWAIEAFKLMNPTSLEIYVFDQEKDSWYAWMPHNSEEGGVDGAYWCQINRPPRPSGPWTGIGTRSLEANGQAAIDSLFRD